MRRVTLVVIAAALLALPSGAAASPLNFFTVSPGTVNGGATATGTVSLAWLDVAPTTVLLFSSDPSAAQVPSTVVVPAGEREATFPITTSAAAPPTGVQLSAWVDNVRRTANLGVNFAAPAGPALNALTVIPSSLTGGGGATGTVSFTGAMRDGAVVQLSSSHPALVRVPSETVVRAGASAASFAIATSAVTATTSVTVTATWFGARRTATMTLSPGAPPAADRVRITTARWSRGILTIEATSTNRNAVLTVHSRSGAVMFTLTNRGNGRWSDQRPWLDNPGQITVRSNFGGSATATVRR